MGGRLSLESHCLSHQQMSPVPPFRSGVALISVHRVLERDIFKWVSAPFWHRPSSFPLGPFLRERLQSKAHSLHRLLITLPCEHAHISLLVWPKGICFLAFAPKLGIYTKNPSLLAHVLHIRFSKHLRLLRKQQAGEGCGLNCIELLATSATWTNCCGLDSSFPVLSMGP